MPRSTHAAWLVFVFAVPLWCQTKPIAPPANLPALAGKIPCGNLRSLTSYGFSIISAETVAVKGNTPAHCHVTGQVLPDIRFIIDLPEANWNRRFAMHGNGGFAGEPLADPRVANRRARYLRMGFAISGSNTGHDAREQSGASFARNRQQLLDYAFRSLHVTAETSKRVINAYYGVPPTRSYYEGCSTGGRQGLILAQRFPDDFDGIVAGAPVHEFCGTFVSFVWNAQALAAAPIPQEKMLLVADRLVANCDAVDGLKDGLITDPRRCDFQLERDLPLCPAATDAPTCLTAAQIGALEKVYSGPRSTDGRQWFPGWPLTAEMANPANGRSGWDPWIVAAEGQKSISRNMVESVLEHMAFEPGSPKADIASFDFNKDPQRLEWLRTIVDATDPDLTAFQKSGGKLLMYFGWADQALNAQTAIDYYERATSRTGPSTPEFFRLFMIPGMFHCGGGPGPDQFDALGAVMDWVEKGRAPKQILASKMKEGKPVRTRPLCPHPQVAKYNGTGDPDAASSFTCAVN